MKTPLNSSLTCLALLAVTPVLLTQACGSKSSGKGSDAPPASADLTGSWQVPCQVSEMFGEPTVYGTSVTEFSTDRITSTDHYYADENCTEDLFVNITTAKIVSSKKTTKTDYELSLQITADRITVTSQESTFQMIDDNEFCYFAPGEYSLNTEYQCSDLASMVIPVTLRQEGDTLSFFDEDTGTFGNQATRRP